MGELSLTISIVLNALFIILILSLSIWKMSDIAFRQDEEDIDDWVTWESAFIFTELKRADWSWEGVFSKGDCS